MPDSLLSPAEFAQQIKAKYPDYASVPDAELATKMLEKYPEYRDRVRSVAPPITRVPQSDSSGLALGGAHALVSPATTAVEELATRPGLVKAGQVAGEVAGGVTGLVKGGPVGAGLGMIAGERTGGLLTTAAQRLAAPVATLMERAAPYAQALSTASGAQGALDLAQMAEPTRQDIGFLGLTVNGAPPDPTHPALINLMAMKASDAIASLMKEGLSMGEAAKTWWKLKTMPPVPPPTAPPAPVQPVSPPLPLPTPSSAVDPRLPPALAPTTPYTLEEAMHRLGQSPTRYADRLRGGKP